MNAILNGVNLDSSNLNDSASLNASASLNDNASLEDSASEMISSENTAKVIEIASKVKKDNNTRFPAELIKQPSNLAVNANTFFQWLLLFLFCLLLIHYYQLSII